jgi:heme-degrading monooxygenase HmoA
VPFVSVTRLRVRSVRFIPAFFWYAIRSQRQVRSAIGFQGGALLADAKWTYWTLTAWDSLEAMRAYMTAGAHRKAMPKLTNWCDEASVVHWQSDGQQIPDWREAAERMQRQGRPSKIRYPSPDHQGLSFSIPKGFANTMKIVSTPK